MRKQFDHIGRALSLLIFIAGIGLLIVVFAVAYHMLTNPVPGLAAALTTPATQNNSQQPLVGISSAVISFLLRLAVLLLMTVSASLIAARGIHLYFAAIGAGQSHETIQAAPDPGPAGNHSADSQSAAAPAASSGNRGSREAPSEREGMDTAPVVETVAKPRQ